MLHVFGIIDHHGQGQRWDRNLKSAQVAAPLTASKPIQKDVPGLQEPDPIADERKRAGWSTDDRLVSEGIFTLWGGENQTAVFSHDA